MDDKYARRSLLLTSISLPLGIFIGKSVELVLKSTNPSHVNIAADLAYLAHIMLTTMAAVVICWILALAFAYKAHKQQENKTAVKFAAATLLVVIALTLSLLLLNKAVTTKIEQAKLQTINSQQ